MSELTPEQVACATMVTHEQLRAAVVLVESLVTRVDALEVRVTEQEKRPMVKSRAEYMRKYRAKGKTVTVAEAFQALADAMPKTVATWSDQGTVSDTPPA